MNGRKLLVLATGPDETFAAVGPVYSEGAALELALEISAAGWKPDGVRASMSRAEFRAMVKRQTAAPSGRKEGSGE